MAFSSLGTSFTATQSPTLGSSELDPRASTMHLPVTCASRVVVVFEQLQHSFQVIWSPKNRRSKYSRRIVAVNRSINGWDQGTWGTVCTVSTPRMRRLAYQRRNRNSGS